MAELHLKSRVVPFAVLTPTQPAPVLYWIWRSLRPYRARVAVLSVLSIAEVGLRVLTPWPMQSVIDHVLGSLPPPAWLSASVMRLDPLIGFVDDPQARLLIAVVAGGLLVQLAHQLVMLFHSRITAATGHRMVRDLRERMFAHLQSLPLSGHAHLPTGEAVYRLEVDAACLEHLVMRGFFPIVFSILTLVAMFTVLAAIDLQLAFIALGIAPLLYGWLRFYTRRMQSSAQRAKTFESRLMQRGHETLAAIGLVKTYAREDFEQTRFSEAAGLAVEARVETTRQEAIFGAVVSALTITGTAVVVLAGGLSVLHGRISMGTLLVLCAYLGFVYGPLCGIAHTFGALQQAMASARRVHETLGLPAEPLEAEGLDGRKVRGYLRFEDVSFAYDGNRQVLRNVSFAARPGEMIALVGLSGAGKTTIASLITRLYEPTNGRIVLDGDSLDRYNLRALRQQIAVVLQEAAVVSGTIRDNVRYGRLEASDVEIESAARSAYAHEFIDGLAEQYETVVGEGGQGLSGGQRQRLSVARAFLKNAPVLILDEPTAALDTVAEDRLVAGLDRLRAGRTTIVIAHRLSTVRAADRILVLDAGRISAEGTHDELMVSSPLYRRLAGQLVTERAVA